MQAGKRSINKKIEGIMEVVRSNIESLEGLAARQALRTYGGRIGKTLTEEKLFNALKAAVPTMTSEIYSAELSEYKKRKQSREKAKISKTPLPTMRKP